MRCIIKLYFTTIMLFVILAVPFALCANNVPDYTVHDLKGESHRLSDILAELPSDGLLILNFTSIYSAPCKKGIPELLNVEKESKHVRLICIFVDNTEGAARYAEKHHINNLSYVDKWSSISSKFKIMGVPYTIVLNKNSEILGRFDSYTNEDITLIKELVSR